MRRLARVAAIPFHVRRMHRDGWTWNQAIRNACSWAWGWES